MAPNQPIPTLVIGLGGTGAIATVQLKEQLLNMYNNQLPASIGLLVFDTDSNPLSQYQWTRVRLDTREFGHLGMTDNRATSAKPWLERVARSGKNDDMKYLSGWLQASWYLENLPDDVMFLDKGAGQWRQMGRLALFQDVINEGQSAFYVRVCSAIDKIREASRAVTLNVFIVCSATGGTGAGTLLDVAYLVRKIAKERANFEIKLRAMIVLPQAFDATLPQNQKQGARIRAAAAVRELGRFVMNEDWGEGYPMYYHPSGDPATPVVWRDKLKSKLLDFVYLLDGERLNQYLVAKGVAPTLADTLLAFVDSNVGAYVGSYNVNISQTQTESRIDRGRIPFVGSLGTYSIILPIQQMIEGWAYTLAYDTVKLLTAPDESQVNKASATPNAVRPDANQERTTKPDAEVQNLMTTITPIYDVDDPTNKRQPTILWRELHKMYADYQANDTAFIRQLQNFDMERWQRILLPDTESQDTATKAKMVRVNKERTKTMETEVQTSDQIEGGEDTCMGCERIKRKADDLLDKQIGMPRPGGGRSGGDFQVFATTCKEIQFSIFTDVMTLYLKMMLNGQDPQAPIKSRAGKVGWIVAVLKQMDYVLNEVYQLLGKVREGDSARNSPRGQKIQAYNTAYEDMKAHCQETGGLFGIGGNPAIRTQKEFITTADDLLKVYRGEVIRDELINTVRLMRDFVRGTYENLGNWLQVLLFDSKGLYSTTLRGIDRVKTDRMNLERIECRRIIEDEAWEADRYQYYSDKADVQNHAMRAFQWEVKPATDRQGNATLRLGLMMNGQPLSFDRNAPRWEKNNEELIMAYCREVFKDARENETALGYLRAKHSANELGAELIGHSGALIAYKPQGESGRGIQPSFGNMLLAYRADNSEDETFLAELLDYLRGKRGGNADDATRFSQQSCDDPFRLTVVTLVELLPLYELQSVVQNREAYLLAPLERRRLAHVFPAEVNIVDYEERLPELGQVKRTLEDQVSILIEDRSLFVEFLTLTAYGVIIQDLDNITKDDTGEDLKVFFLLAPKANNPEEMDEWWLTRPEFDPSMFDAMMAYIYYGRDMGLEVHRPGYYQKIVYERVRNYLNRVKQKQARRVFVRSEIGDNDKSNNQMFKLYQWFQEVAGVKGLSVGDEAYTQQIKAAYENEKVKDFAVAAVEYQILARFAELLEGELAQAARILKTYEGKDGVNRTEEQKYKELRDLYSLAILVLRDEANTKFDTAGRRAGHGKSVSVATTDAANSEANQPRRSARPHRPLDRDDD